MAEPWSEQPSDLAPFVVAVLEQTETIRELRAQLDGCQKVEVTGPNGVPVYAQGSFQDGMFNPDSWDVQWYVGLEKVPQKPSSDGTGDKDSKGATIPLRDLSKIEIRLGGVLFASASSKEVTGTSPQLCIGNKFDGDNLTRSIVFRFGVEGRDAWLTFHFRGLPKEAWTNLQSVALNNLEVKEGIRKMIFTRFFHTSWLRPFHHRQ